MGKDLSKDGRRARCDSPAGRREGGVTNGNWTTVRSNDLCGRLGAVWLSSDHVPGLREAGSPADRLIEFLCAPVDNGSNDCWWR